MEQFILHHLYLTYGCIAALVVVVPTIHYFYYKQELVFLETISSLYTDTVFKFTLDQEKGLKIRSKDDPLMKGIQELRMSKSHFLSCVRHAKFDKDQVCYPMNVGGREGMVTGPTMQLIDSTELLCAPAIQALIDHVIGHHRDKKKNSFNPVYWILLVPRMPQSIAGMIIDAFKRHLP